MFILPPSSEVINLDFCSQEKKTLREEKLKQEEKYMWAVVDGVREKVLFLYCDFLTAFLNHI